MKSTGVNDPAARGNLRGVELAFDMNEFIDQSQQRSRYSSFAGSDHPVTRGAIQFLDGIGNGLNGLQQWANDASRALTDQLMRFVQGGNR